MIQVDMGYNIHIYGNVTVKPLYNYHILIKRLKKERSTWLQTSLIIIPYYISQSVL
jgi:hypothetical protein